MCALQGVSNNYDTDLILPIVEAAAQLAGIDYFSVDRCAASAHHQRAAMCTEQACDHVPSRHVIKKVEVWTASTARTALQWCTEAA